MFRKHHIGFSIFMLYMILFPSFLSLAETDNLSEYRIKAAYLYNFAKFVEWPASSFDSPNSPIILCILGDSPFEDALKEIENKSMRGRVLKVRQCRNIEDITGCHILFISDSETENLKIILSKIQKQPFLTVSDMDGFARMGGMINFIRTDNKIRFEVNLKAAENASIKISSRLLKIAILVN